MIAERDGEDGDPALEVLRHDLRREALSVGERGHDLSPPHDHVVHRQEDPLGVHQRGGAHALFSQGGDRRVMAGNLDAQRQRDGDQGANQTDVSVHVSWGD